MDNEVMELIDQLYTMVSEAWGVPLGNEKCIVERDQVLEILDEIKTAMPVELSEAKRLVSARDEFINNAKREAEGIRNQAEERARALVNDQEIVRIAKARSNEMLASTQAKADALRQASSQFCVDALRRTEEAISAALGSVQQAHAAFQGVAGSTAAPAAPAAAPAARQPEIHFEDDAPLDEEVTDCRLTAHLNRRRSIRRRFCVLPKIFPAQCAPGVPGGCFFPVWRHILCRHFLFSARNAKPCDRENNGRIARNVGNCKKWAGISPCNFSVLPL